jgi:hypothetical protein
MHGPWAGLGLKLDATILSGRQYDRDLIEREFESPRRRVT